MVKAIIQSCKQQGTACVWVESLVCEPNPGLSLLKGKEKNPVPTGNILLTGYRLPQRG
jgi:hypothetical protein